MRAGHHRQKGYGQGTWEPTGALYRQIAAGFSATRSLASLAIEPFSVTLFRVEQGNGIGQAKRHLR